MAVDQVQVLPTPIKSSQDAKDYKVIKLPNGLKALLVSDTSYDLEKLDQEEAELTENVFNEDEEKEDEEDEEEMEEGSDHDSEGSGEEDMDEDKEDEEGGGKKLQAKVSGLKKSAAGLCVGMGSFSDPLELPGLAHFLEHMVFMGSKKFPKENGFENYVSKHGGFDNAHTDCEHTTFYFDVQRKHLAKSLDMFAQFFIEPLMQKNAMEREREAVDSEFQMALPSDYNRQLQIFSSIAKKGHPMSKFMWGNKQSLLMEHLDANPGQINSCIPKDKLPMSKRLDMEHLDDDAVHEKLHAFRSRHYTAQSMTLVVQSQETLDTLEKLVVDIFSKVPNNGLEKESFNHLARPFDTPDFHKLYKVAPLRNVFQVELIWSLPPLLKEYKCKPLEYLAWIIGHEGKGSLILYLRKKVWALSLIAGCECDGFEMNSTHSQFAITITLTQQGFDELDQVLNAVFSYLKMLIEAGPNERIFGEIKEIDGLNFKYKEECQSIENVEHLAENMQTYPPEHILCGSELMFEFDAKLLESCTKELRSDNVCIFVSAREFAEGCDKVEPWFKTNYKVEDIPQSWKDQWNNPQVDSDMFLPTPNKFIAKDLDLKNVETSQITPFPSRLIETVQGELFYRFDTNFNQPRAIIKVHVMVPAILDSLKNAVCMDLLISCLSQQMIKDTYPAAIAQLNYSVDSSERGIQIGLSGLNDKLNKLMDTILNHFEDFEKNFEAELFQAVQDQVKKNYYNNFIKPQRLVKDLRLFLLQDVFRTHREKHRIIGDVTIDDVLEFSRNMYKKPLYVQTLVQGNMSPQEATNIHESIIKTFNNDNKSVDKVPEIAVNEVPCGIHVLKVDSFNAKDNNTLVTNYYQLGPGTLHEHMLLEVGCHIMEEPVFDTLRTKEQLGYSVFNMLKYTNGILGMSITVNSQATKFTASYVDERIEAFLDWFINEKLAKLSDDEFNTSIATLIKMKGQADVTLAEEVRRNWSEVTTREYLFDRLQQEIALLESCNKDEMVKFVSDLLNKVNEKRRKLSVQVIGSSVIDTETLEDDPDDTVYEIKYHNEDGKDFIKDIIEFKAKMPTYAIHKIVD